MAQREKEETEFKVPETLTLCTNGCGFPGNPATKNMCQNCFKANAEVLKPLNFSSSSSSQDNKSRSSSSRSSPARSDSESDLLLMKTRREPTALKTTTTEATTAVSAEGTDSTNTQRREVNRCSGCRRKVGLTGFRCRCGDLFCSEHRYSDRHVCSYDYKTAGREAIARENPVVKAAKIVRV
ncbi:zinc finger A20 and AN1 domain-containing stress-associated protein 5-like [Macadamia integrifolia]|uniref:zinc finger A20 and AN1 domain-containing stress-associated protein 5-like n=1 Tax=Macadamia integrifolia TaxID=60698 RepID=UPI001C50120B|nr:zinc finger A20 and AN1 domain-containing stress-associated protein 5-like [Macadamia integrifolia]